MKECGATVLESSVADMLRGCSIEINSSDTKTVSAAVERLDRGTQVFLTWIPGMDPMEVIGPAALLREAGLLPVPHIGARHLESATQLEGFVSRLSGEANVDRVLIIGGDRAQPAGPYDSSLSVMQTGIFQRAGIYRVAIGAFPEGNPNISNTILDEALQAKVSCARSSGLELSIVTQFCFDAQPIATWLRRLRGRGIVNPIRVGMAGPAGLITLGRYAVRCGVGNSLRVLTDKPSFAKLLVDNGPEPIIRDLFSSLASTNSIDQQLGIAGLHFFVFGGFNKTIDWINTKKGGIR
jgi:methylenetetrahydrofolate reductase (NADPH)